MKTLLMLYGFLFLYNSLFCLCSSTKFGLVNYFKNDVLTSLNLEDDFKCKSTGIACDCQNNTYVYVCFYDGSGNLVAHLADTCKTPQICMESDGGCGTGPNPNCDPKPSMECTSEGMFPDPYDCRKYYVCLKSSDGKTLEPHPNACFGEYGYDPLSTYCKLKLTATGECPNKPIPTCTKLLGPTLIDSNPYMYYMCIKPSGASHGYQPAIYRCPHQEIASSQGCGGSFVTTTPTIPTKTPHTTCQKGDIYIPDYKNCHYYYDCTVSMTNPPHMKCPDNTSFNKQYGMCQDGDGNCP